MPDAERLPSLERSRDVNAALAQSELRQNASRGSPIVPISVKRIEYGQFHVVAIQVFSKYATRNARHLPAFRVVRLERLLQPLFGIPLDILGLTLCRELIGDPGLNDDPRLHIVERAHEVSMTPPRDEAAKESTSARSACAIREPRIPRPQRSAVQHVLTTFHE